MKERPILFSAPMVRAILEGRKTMTRRVVKYPARDGESGWHPIPTGMQYLPGGSARPVRPYGLPGDRLWVRETWLQFGERPLPGQGMPDNACIDYRADYKPENLKAGIDADGDPYPAPKWRPSIFMPRWASRILLEVTAIRVERLKDMPLGDAVLEGMTGPFTYCDFKELWDSINDKRGYGWDANPWVWVVEFRRISA